MTEASPPRTGVSPSAPEPEQDHEPMVLPPSGTGERAKRRRERAAEDETATAGALPEGRRGRRASRRNATVGAAPAPPTDEPDGPERPERRRARAVWRWMFIATMTALVLAIPVLTYIGRDALLRSNSGRELNVEQDPSAPGFVASVDPTPTMMVTQTDAAGAVSGVTVLSLNSSGGGSLTFFPAGTELELPLTETGQATMDVIYQGAGVSGLEQRVETLLGAATEESVEIRDDTGQWATLLTPLGPLAIDNPVELTATDAAGAPVSFARGPIQVPPEQIGLFVNTRGADDNDLTRLERQQAFWTAWLAAVKSSTDPSAVPGETDKGLGHFVRDLAKGDAAFNTLPVTPIGIPGVPATDTNLYEPDQTAVDALVAATIPFPVGVGRLRARVLDGTGTEGLAARAAGVIVPTGAEISFIGNAESFGHRQTILRYYDRANRDTAQRMLDALGGGHLVLRENVTDTVDVTVIVGSAFDPATAPGASATSTTSTSIVGETTVPIDPFAAATTVPFGTPPSFTPPTEVPGAVPTG